MTFWMVAGGLMWASLGGELGLSADEPGATPQFQTVFDLVRSNLTGSAATDLNRAAVQGFLSQLGGRVALEKPDPAQDASGASLSPVSQVRLLDEAYGYLRVTRVGAGLAEEIRSNYERLQSTNTLKGLILDLRFAEGADYSAAAQTADLFLTSARPLLLCDDRPLSSTAKAKAIPTPVAILVNHKTSGAAEALAAVFRQAELGLLIGSTTAGKAMVFKEFALSDGQTLRIASGMIRLGNGDVLPAQGLAPDIQVAVTRADEEAYYGDAYKTLPNPLAVAAFSHGATNKAGLLGGTNRSGARINEAELVRLRSEGQDIDSENPNPPPKAVEPSKPVVQDPVLARALDLLKGLAVVRKSRQP
jgi:hypothetical protein